MTGPVGLGITVATVAAGYLLLGNNSEKTTVSLRENNEAVNDAIQKYRELDDVQKRGQQAAEKVKLSELAEGYKELTTDLNTSAYALSRHNDFTREQSREVNALIAEFMQTVDLDKFSAAINKLSFVSQDSKDKFNALAGQVRTSGNEYKNQKQFVDAMTNSLNQNAAAGDNAARGIRNAAEAVAEYTGKLKSQQWDLEFTNALVQKHGKSAQEADLLLQAYRENEKKGIKGVTVEQKKIISNIEAQRRSADAYNKAQADALVRQKKAAKETTSQPQKDKKEAERLAKEQFDLREQIVYESAHREKQIELDLAREIAEIRKAKFNPEDTAGLIGNAEARAGYEKELYTEQLKYQLNEWQWTEEEKLDQRVKINRLLILSSRELTDTNKQYSLDSMVDQSNHELALIKHSQETRLFQMREALMFETAAMQERYRLEREQILLNSKLSQEQKQREIALSKALQEEENRKRLNNAVQQWGGIQAEMNGTTGQFNLEKERFDRLDKSQALFDAELAMAGENYALKEQAYQAHVDRMSAIENAYSVSSLQLQLGYGQQMASSMSSMMGAIFGEKSKAYAAAFAVEKAFAVAQAAIAMGQNIAQASAIGFPQNIPMIAGAMAQGAQIASIIASVAAPTGYSDGGFTGYGGKFDPAGIVHKGEVVWSQEDIKRWGGVNVVEAMRTSQPPKGYSDGGLVTSQDTYRVGMGTVEAINRNSDVQAERQAQTSAQAQSANPQPIENNLRVIFVRDENEAKEMLYGPDGEKAFLYHQKRNKSKLA